MGRSVKRFGKVALGACVGLAIAGCVSASQSNRIARAAPPPVTPGAAPESLIGMRLGALLAMGDVDGYVALAQALPSGNDEISTRARVQADFLAGDDGAAACRGPNGCEN